jgi:hypothetical protein
MARDPLPLSSPRVPDYLRPWLVLAAGLALIGIGLVFLLTSLAAPRALCLVAGLLVTGSAVSWRLRTSGQDFNDRATSFGFLALAFLGVLLAYVGARGWPVAQLFLGVLAAVALAGSVLVLLPSLARRIVVSLIILYHFGGILTAVTSVPPPGGEPPWLSLQLWNNFGYGPYLRFIYLINAYHFYSPDPGPPHHLWFYVRYKDGSSRWVKLPNRDTSPTALSYQRTLALTESIHQTDGTPMTSDQWAEFHKRNPGWKPEPDDPVEQDSWDLIMKRRGVGAALHPELRFIQDLPSPSAQYFRPTKYARKLVASYARHVAWTTPHPDDPSLPVESVKVYLARHEMVTPDKWSQDGNAIKDERLFVVWFMGEFNRDGKLLEPKEPFLYWRLPIAYVTRDFPRDLPPDVGVSLTQPPDSEHPRLFNAVEFHAELGKRP